MKKQLLLLLLSLIFLTNALNAQEPSDDTPIKIDTLLLTMPLVVKDKDGHNITGLKKEAFQLSKTTTNKISNIFSTKNRR